MKTRIPLPPNAFIDNGGRSLPPPIAYHGRTHPTSITIAATTASVRPRPIGRRTSGRLGIDLGAKDAHEAQVAVELAVVEPVAHDELVRNREANVVDGDLDETTRRLVKQGADAERP